MRFFGGANQLTLRVDGVGPPARGPSASPPVVLLPAGCRPLPKLLCLSAIPCFGQSLHERAPAHCSHQRQHRSGTWNPLSKGCHCKQELPQIFIVIALVPDPPRGGASRIYLGLVGSHTLHSTHGNLAKLLVILWVVITGIIHGAGNGGESHGGDGFT